MRNLLLTILVLMLVSASNAAEVSFTMDDPNVKQSPLMSPFERNEKILSAFQKNKIKGALFVCGMRVDSEEGKALLQSWDEAGHMIGNHSYNHLYYHSVDRPFDAFRDDMLLAEPLIQNFKHYTKIFRFPFLKEGDTPDKRDQMREFLKKNGFANGYVTIDASDWYVDERLNKRLKQNPKADVAPYKDFYLKHMMDRAVFYNELSKKVFGREIKHTILVHHSLLNALFLNDLMKEFKKNKWKLISASEAFQDPIFNLEPKILPAGESIVWAAAKELGQYKQFIRYPGEDGDYEKAAMDKLGL